MTLLQNWTLSVGVTVLANIPFSSHCSLVTNHNWVSHLKRMCRWDQFHSQFLMSANKTTHVAVSALLLKQATSITFEYMKLFNWNFFNLSGWTIFRMTLFSAHFYNMEAKSFSRPVPFCYVKSPIARFWTESFLPLKCIKFATKFHYHRNCLFKKTRFLTKKVFLKKLIFPPDFYTLKSIIDTKIHIWTYSSITCPKFTQKLAFLFILTEHLARVLFFFYWKTTQMLISFQWVAEVWTCVKTETKTFVRHQKVKFFKLPMIQSAPSWNG